MAKPRKQNTPSRSEGVVPRICVICGVDDMLKRQRLEDLRRQLYDTHGPLDESSFDGKTASLSDVLDEVRSLSLMQQHKLVIVDEADSFAAAHRASLERYAKSPINEATLVLRSQKWHRGNLDKLIEKTGFIVKCDPLRPAEAARWLSKRSQHFYKSRLTPSVAAMLVNRLGCDLTRLDTELAKLAACVGQGQAINEATVRQFVGFFSQDDAWTVQQAVLESLASVHTASSRPQAEAVIQKVHELVNVARQADVFVAYCLTDLFRKLMLGKIMVCEGCSSGQIATRLKLWGPSRATFLSVLNHISRERAASLFDAALAYDARSKTGLGNPTRNIECFCAVLADNQA